MLVKRVTKSAIAFEISRLRIFHAVTSEVVIVTVKKANFLANFRRQQLQTMKSCQVQSCDCHVTDPVVNPSYDLVWLLLLYFGI